MRIIAIAGNKHSGKNTLAKLLSTEHSRIVSFATPLKEGITTLSNNVIQFNYQNNTDHTKSTECISEVIVTWLQQKRIIAKEEVRGLLTEVANACIKHDPSFFIKSMATRIKDIETTYKAMGIEPTIFIDDLRTMDEFIFLSQINAKFVYVETIANYSPLLLKGTSLITKRLWWLPFCLLDSLLFYWLKLMYWLNKEYPDYSHTSERQVFLLKELIEFHLFNHKHQAQDILQWLDNNN